MKARHFLVALSLLAFSLTLSAASRPNIVMIISDDHMWADYGFMGHPHVKTPNLDRLASESLTFPRGYVPSSLCCPSLASAITGLFPHQHKVTSNDPPVPAGTPKAKASKSKAFETGREQMNRFMEAVPTLPRVLVKEGYLALQTGKWWQGHYSRGGFTHGMTKGSRHGDEGLDIGRKTMQPIYDFIATAKKEQKPFFIWYAPMMPHTPHTPPEGLFKKYRALTESDSIAKYWAMIEWFDDTCGQLLKHLEEQGIAQDTIVTYVADNGWIQNPTGNNYAVKSKQSQYDGGLRTPIMLRWTSRVKPQRSESLVSSIDLMPTLLTAAGLKPTADMQGINLFDPAALSARKRIFGECFTHNAVDLNHPAASLRWRWMIEGDWKIIVPAPQNESGPIELYDLRQDPLEQTNLADKEGVRVLSMRQALDAWWPAK